MNARAASQSAPASIGFSERAGVTVLTIESELATATLSLFGGQVLTWQPRHAGEPVLWLSESAFFDAKTAIRGGVPICWPWFGPHPEDPAAAPAHGYARISAWRLERLTARGDGGVEIVLALAGGGGAAALALTQTIEIGRALEISLATTNLGPFAATYSEGLHTYFNVSDISKVEVSGLDRREYIDLTSNNARRTQQGKIRFEGELGRLFVNTADTCILEDSGFERSIRIEKFNSQSTAVWNPALRVAEKMRDLGPTNWRTMACVETANASDNTLTLQPGAMRTMGTRYTVESTRPV